MIRPLTLADCDAVAALEASLFESALDQPRLYTLVKNPVFYGLVGMRQDGGARDPQSTALHHLSVGGYLLATIIEDEAEILSIAVAPDLQGRGMGGALLQSLLDHGAVANVSQVTLEVAADNLPALGLYRNHGFAEFGRRKGYYKRGNQKFDAIMMKWCAAEAFS